jgi:riboflavin synthase
MFTGIIQELGRVQSIAPKMIAVKSSFSDPAVGESIAINGVCLTLKRAERAVFYFDTMAETRRATNLGKLRVQSPVNLERALKIGESIGGHFVSGHVDEAGKIARINKKPDEVVLEITVSAVNRKYLVPKGSVAVDGISLTVIKVTPQGFAVSLIPLTLKETTLGTAKPGTLVNIEYDQLVKSTMNLLEDKFRNSSYITARYLKEKGF